MSWSLNSIFCGCIPFGVVESTVSHPTGAKVLSSKLETASKTGVLNIADMKLTGSSNVWSKLRDDNLHLKILDVSGNQLTELPMEISTSMINLKTLHASRCGIQRITGLTALDKLTVLNLDKNDLETDVVMGLPITLLRLNLSSNHLSALPISLRSLLLLTELNLSNNRVQSLVGIGELISLVSLNLNDNLLSELPEETNRLVKLKQISLKDNRISKKAVSHDGQSIPASFLLQTLVDSIDLGGNAGLTKAQVLEFDGIQAFIERRKKSKDKSFQGGAITDFNLFGLD